MLHCILMLMLSFLGIHCNHKKIKRNIASKFLASSYSHRASLGLKQRRMSLYSHSLKFVYLTRNWQKSCTWKTSKKTTGLHPCANFPVLLNSVYMLSDNLLKSFRGDSGATSLMTKRTSSSMWWSTFSRTSIWTALRHVKQSTMNELHLSNTSSPRLKHCQSDSALGFYLVKLIYINKTLSIEFAHDIHRCEKTLASRKLVFVNMNKATKFADWIGRMKGMGIKQCSYTHRGRFPPLSPICDLHCRVMQLKPSGHRTPRLLVIKQLCTPTWRQIIMSGDDTTNWRLVFWTVGGTNSSITSAASLSTSWSKICVGRPASALITLPPWVSRNNISRSRRLLCYETQRPQMEYAISGVSPDNHLFKKAVPIFRHTSSLAVLYILSLEVWVFMYSFTFLSLTISQYLRTRF